MRVHVDAWDPGYGTALAAEGNPSNARVDTDVETADWAPVTPVVRDEPRLIRLVDGVRRIDARLWLSEGDGPPRLGVAASYAAGVVTCDLAAGSAVLSSALVERGLFAADRIDDVPAHGSAVYRSFPIGTDDPAQLDAALQSRLRELEIEAAKQAGTDHDLLIVDGPLSGRGALPRALGYIKTHRAQYLPPAHTAVVGQLAPGQRTPVFLLGSTWERYTWYVRLPGGDGAPWAGVVRVECAMSVTDPAALADRSAGTLCALASTPYKDPRAPQNLLPIGGLERRLRALLGDARLLHRGLRLAAQ